LERSGLLRLRLGLVVQRGGLLQGLFGKPLGRLVVLRNTTAEEMAGKESLALSFAGAGLLAGLLVIGIYFFASSVERRLLRSIMDRDSEASALHALQDRLASTLRSIGDAVISNDLEGRVTSMNPMAETLTGWSFQESRAGR
jgi:PAS domain-containing protein